MSAGVLAPAPTADRLRTWHPGWMGVVMGTAGTAVAALLDPWPALLVDEILGAVLTALAVVLVPFLLVPYWRRLRLHREATRADFAHPGLGALFGTIPASLLIVGLALAQLAVLGWLPAATAWVSAALLLVGVVGAVAVAVGFFSGVVARDQIPVEAMTGAWFVPLVALVLVPSVVLRLTVLQPAWPPGPWAALAAAAVGAGLMLFLLIAPVLAWRLITSPAPATHQAPSWWIWLAPMGAGGLGLIATSRLAGTVGPAAAAELVPFLGLLAATGLWGLGAWWTLFAGRILVRNLRNGGGLPFHIGSWGFAFPSAAMTALTVELGRAWELPLLQALGGAGFVLLVALVAALAVRTVAGVRSQHLFQH